MCESESGREGWGREQKERKKEREREEREEQEERELKYCQVWANANF